MYNKHNDGSPISCLCILILNCRSYFRPHFELKMIFKSVSLLIAAAFPPRIRICYALGKVADRRPLCLQYLCLILLSPPLHLFIELFMKFFYPAKLGFLEFGIKVFGFLYDNIFTTYYCKCLSEMKLNLKHDICNALEPGFELSPFTTRSLEKEHFWFTFLFPSNWDQNQIFLEL